MAACPWLCIGYSTAWNLPSTLCAALPPHALSTLRSAQHALCARAGGSVLRRQLNHSPPCFLNPGNSPVAGSRAFKPLYATPAFLLCVKEPDRGGGGKGRERGEDEILHWEFCHSFPMGAGPSCVFVCEPFFSQTIIQ